MLAILVKFAQDDSLKTYTIIINWIPRLDAAGNYWKKLMNVIRLNTRLIDRYYSNEPRSLRMKHLKA